MFYNIVFIFLLFYNFLNHNCLHPEIAILERFHKYTEMSDATLLLNYLRFNPRREDEIFPAAVHSRECRHSTTSQEHARSRERNQFASSKLGRENSSRARYEIKEKARSFKGWQGGNRGTRGPPTETCPLSGCPIADPSLFRPSSSGHTRNHAQFPPIGQWKRWELAKLAAPAPAFVAEPLRPNTTWHASELHVHSRSCESPVRARVRALARNFARDREAVVHSDHREYRST